MKIYVATRCRMLAEWLNEVAYRLDPPKAENPANTLLRQIIESNNQKMLLQAQRKEREALKGWQ